MKLRLLHPFAALAAFFLTTTSHAQLVQTWMLGEDDSLQTEFEGEFQTDDFYYVADGDYTGLSTAGVVWSQGMEPLNDGIASNGIGFERAFTEFDNTTHIYFQLTAAEAAAGNNFRFEVEFIEAEPGSLHDMEVTFNGQFVASQLGVDAASGAEVLLSADFTAASVNAVAGSNFISITRTGGSGAYIQMDFVRLESEASVACEDPICSFSGGPSMIAPGGSATLRWETDPAATLSIDQGVGGIAAGIGSIQVFPIANTTYTLTSTVGAVSDTATATITIANINSFTSSTNQALPNAAVDLSWDVDPDPGVTVSIDNGVGDVTANTTAGVGMITVNPAATTTYTLTSTRPNSPANDVETATVTVTVNTFTTLWKIGIDNGDESEFETEGAADDFFYVEDGDYTGLTPPGALWTSGPEPWSVPEDNLLGFERALTPNDPDVNIYFNLNSGQANPGVTFQFFAELQRGQDGSMHDIEFRLNNVVFDSKADVSTDGGVTVPVEKIFTGGDIGTQLGPNVLTIARTGGEGNWIQFDFIELKADLSTANCPDPICSYAASPNVVAPGGASVLTWATAPAATLTIDGGVGNVDALTTSGIGSVSVSPTQNTTYTLTSDLNGTIGTESVTVMVDNINSFSVAPATVRPGVPAVLMWDVDPSASVSIDSGVGNVDAQTVDGIGSIEVSPTADTTYTLTSTRGSDVETATVTVIASTLTLLWQIGEDNDGQGEFENENLTEPDFYVDSGDYTATSPDGGNRFGVLWEDGFEILNDGMDGNSIGFGRALSGGVSFVDIFFQLEADEANSNAQFLFSTEFRAAQEDSTHDLEFSLNGNSFHSVTGVDAVGNNEVLVTDTFTGSEVGAQVGPNVLTVSRTGGSGGWIQMDYLTLEVQPATTENFRITEITYANGEVVLKWNSIPGIDYRVVSSTDLAEFEFEVEEVVPATGETTTYTDTFVPAGADRLFYRVEILEN